MRTVAIAVLFAALVAWSPPLHAQQQDPNNPGNNGWQLHDPNEYTQEDSHPVRAIASLLSPIGWALEWGIARPWHYVATNTFLAPVLNGGEQDDTWTEYYGTPGQNAEAPMVPPVTEPRASAQPLREQNLGPGAAPANSGSSAATNPPPVGAPPYSQTEQQGQSVLH
jgi:hypothetical protein